MDSFNVVTDKWVPCVNSNGEQVKVSLIELFSDQSLIAFVGDSIERYCLLRFCGAIAQSSKKNQPADKSEWKELRDSYAANVIEYLNENINLFYMDGDIPFLQFNPETERDLNDTYFRKNYALEKNAIKCELRDWHVRNNTQIVSQSLMRSDYSMPTVVLDLLVHQMFSLPVTSVLYKPGKTSGKAAYHNSSRAMKYENSTKGNINIYATTSNIIDSIWYNMEFANNFGHPVWETRFVENDSYLAKLVPLTSRIKILPGLKEMYYFKGLEYSSTIDDLQYHIITEENYSHLDVKSGKLISEKVQRPMSTSHNGKWWRDFEIICASEESTTANIFKNERIRQVDTLNVNSVGILFKAGQFGLLTVSKINDSTYTYKNPSKLSSDEFREMYAQIVKESKNIEGQLKEVSKKAIIETKKKKELAKTEVVELNAKVEQIVEQFNDELDRRSNDICNYDPLTGYTEWCKVIKKAIEKAAFTVEKKFGLVASHTIQTSIHIHKEF